MPTSRNNIFFGTAKEIFITQNLLSAISYLQSDINVLNVVYQEQASYIMSNSCWFDLDLRLRIPRPRRLRQLEP